MESRPLLNVGEDPGIKYTKLTKLQTQVCTWSDLVESFIIFYSFTSFVISWFFRSISPRSPAACYRRALRLGCCKVFTVSPFTCHLLGPPTTARLPSPASSSLTNRRFWGVNFRHQDAQSDWISIRINLYCQSSLYHHFIHSDPEADGTSGIISVFWCLFQCFRAVTIELWTSFDPLHPAAKGLAIRPASCRCVEFFDVFCLAAMFHENKIVITLIISPETTLGLWRVRRLFRQFDKIWS